MNDEQVKTLAAHGVSEETSALAYSLGITFDDVARWVNTYGAGVASLFREVLDDYKAGKLRGFGAALIVVGYFQKYGSTVGAFLKELFDKLGLSGTDTPPGGIAS